MSYTNLGSKLVPGQINFQTTPTGRLPSTYVKHGRYGYVIGQSHIAGCDPCRGLGQPPNQVDDRADQVQQVVEGTVRDTIKSALPPVILTGTGVLVGAIAGVAGGLLGKPILGGLLGAVGGGVLGYWNWKRISSAASTEVIPTSSTAGLGGVMAVL